MKLNKIRPSTYCVFCGNLRGTAFFVTENLLLTAKHNISLYETEGVDILIGKKNEEYICDYVEISKYTDVAILCVRDFRSSNKLEILLKPIKSDQEFTFFGYPQTELGLSVGSSVKIKVIDHWDSFVDLTYNVSAYISSGYLPTEISGASGSPVFDNFENVVGVLTKQLDGCVGFVSLQTIQYELKTQLKDINENWQECDTSLLINKTIRDHVTEAVVHAGPRFSKELNVENSHYKDVLDFLLQDSKYKKIIDNVDTNYFQAKNIISDHIHLLEFSGDDQNYLNELFIDIDQKLPNKEKELVYAIEELLYLLEDKISKKINKANDPDQNSWKKLESIFAELNEYKNISSQDYFQLYSSPYLCIKGSAGKGKTHQLCDIALKLAEITDVLLIFGIQFGNNCTVEPFVKILDVLDQQCSTTEFLLRMQDKAERINKRSFIIIDGINEGASYVYWRDKLPLMIDELKNYSKISLIISIRTPFDKYVNINGFVQIIHNGFSDRVRAINNFFDYYNITVPLWAYSFSEFDNPLFLKLFCETNKNSKNLTNKTHFEIINFFPKLLEMKNMDVCKEIDEDPLRNVCLHFYSEFTKKIISNNLNAIQREDAYKISSKIAPYRLWSKSLLLHMISSNLLIDNIVGHEENIIDYAYEKLGDFFKAAHLYYNRKNSYVKYIKDQLDGKNYKIINVMSVLSKIISDNEHKELFEIDPTFKKNQWVKTAILDGLYWRSDKLTQNPKLHKFIEEDCFKDLGPMQFYLSIFQYICEPTVVFNSNWLHTFLIKKTLCERDKEWTIFVNEMSDSGDLNIYISTSFVRCILCSNDEVIELYSTYLCWLLTSSYPKVRDRVTRLLVSVLTGKPNVAIRLMMKFKDVDDLYVLERLYCAIYGIVLNSENAEEKRLLAKATFDTIFKEKNVPCHFILRGYCRLIIEKAKVEDLIDAELYKQTLPPYNSSYNNLPKDVDYETVLGHNFASEKIYFSVCDFSDFNRYIIGTNNYIYSKEFSKVPLSETAPIDQNKDEDFLELKEMEHQIMIKIKDFGWDGSFFDNFDKSLQSQSRFDNSVERIGKKYQWLALYDILCRLTDNFWYYDDDLKTTKVCEGFWETGHSVNFDPSILIKELSESQQISEFDTFNRLKYDMDSYESLQDWLKETSMPNVKQNITQVDVEGKEWILLHDFISWEKKEEFGIRDLFIRFDSYFVDRKMEGEFAKWAEAQNFYGRWMPESGDHYKYLWKEYIWSPNFKRTLVPYFGWEEATKPKDCPFEVRITTINHLQENMKGLDENEENYLSNVNLLTPDFIKTMNLHLGKSKGCIYDENSKVVAIDSSLIKGHSGFYVEKSILQAYLENKDYILCYVLIGSKTILAGATNLFPHDMSGYFIFNGQKLYGNFDFVKNESLSTSD